MPRFAKLPSGLIINLTSVRRMVPGEAGGGRVLTVYFDDEDSTALTPEDTAALEKRLGLNTKLANARIAIFWIVILAAVLLVFLAIRH